MPQIILKERTAHLARYTFLQEMLINIKTRQSHSSINDQEHLFCITLITGYFRLANIATFLRTPFIEHLQKQSVTDVLQNSCSQKILKLHRKALVLESISKKPAG